MDPIIRKLLENRHITESEEVEEIPAEEEVVEESEEIEVEDEEETLEEDWRDGTFTQQDMERYSKEMFDKARAILFSVEEMRKKHPDFHMDFSKLRNRIKNLF